MRTVVTESLKLRELLASFVKVKLSDFQTRFHNEKWLHAAPGESLRQQADFFWCV